jgi:POT family proton-dependent oligopeptide transporter
VIGHCSNDLSQTNFIQQPLPPGSHTGAGGKDGQSGALNMGQKAATGLNTFYQFWVYVTPLGGAYVADTYVRNSTCLMLRRLTVGPIQWGRYKTICVSVAIAILGHIIMIISAIPGIIDKGSAIGPFALSLVVMGISLGYICELILT